MSKYFRVLVVAFIVALLLGAVLTSVASAWGPCPWYPGGGYYPYWGSGYPYWGGGGYPYWGGGYPHWNYGYYTTCYTYYYSYPSWGGGWWW